MEAADKRRYSNAMEDGAVPLRPKTVAIKGDAAAGC